MTPEQINIAIAEVCGLLIQPACRPSIEQLEAILSSEQKNVIQLLPNGEIRSVLDYYHSLDACAEMRRHVSVEKQLKYGLILSSLCIYQTDDLRWSLSNATAPQHSEAFCRVMGILGEG